MPKVTEKLDEAVFQTHAVGCHRGHDRSDVGVHRFGAGADAPDPQGATIAGLTIADVVPARNLRF